MVDLMLLEHVLPNTLVLLTIVPLLAALICFACNRDTFSFAANIVAAALNIGMASAVFWRLIAGDNPSIVYQVGNWGSHLGIELLLTPLGAVILWLTQFAYVSVSLFINWHWDGRKGGFTAFCSLLALFVAGLNGMILSNDIFNIFVFMEVSSIAGYSMVALGRGRGPLSAFDYLMISSVGASFYLLGAGIIYMEVGVLNITQLRLNISGAELTGAVFLSGLFMLTGLIVKMAVFPLHTWQLRAYDHAPTAFGIMSAAVFSKVFVLVTIKTFLYIFSGFMLGKLGALQIFGVIGVVAMVCGAVMASITTNLRYILAYSGMSQLGYIITAMSMTKTPNASVFIIISHTFTQIALFAAVGTVLNSRRLSMILSALSMASVVGVPGTLGFKAKWLMLYSAFDNQQYFVVGAILLSSVLAIAYAHRFLEGVYSIDFQSRDGSSFMTNALMTTSAVAVIALGIFDLPRLI